VNTALLIGAELLFWGSISVAILLRSWYVLLLLPAGLAFLCATSAYSNLQPIQPNAVSAARRKAFLQILIFAGLVVGSYFLFGAD
jgi:hypothetical protein